MADPVRVATCTDENDNAGVTKAELSVVPAKPHHRSAEYLREHQEALCGDFGGIKPDGSPCMTKAGQGTSTLGSGKCFLHCDERLEGDAAIKRKFLTIYENQPMTVRAAAEQCGVSYVTILRHRKRDPDFDHECQAILDVVSEARAQFIEDSASLRAMDPSNNADTLRIFMLKNLMSHKYKDVYGAEHSGPGGGPIPVLQHNVRWNVDGQPIRFFAETEPREEIPLPPARD